MITEMGSIDAMPVYIQWESRPKLLHFTVKAAMRDWPGEKRR